MKIQPISNNVFLLQDKGDTSIAGLAIPESERKAACKGTVVSVGPGWTSTVTGVLQPITVKEGDKVVYQEHTATIVDFYGTEYICVKETDLLTIYNEN